MILKKIEKKGERNVIADSLRNPGEIEELKKSGSFFLIAVTADIKIRYQRIQDRKRVDDQISFEEFKAAEEKQLRGDKANQQLIKCIKMADFQITNDKTFQDLYHQIEEILKKIEVN
ncbi:MAG: hypothetical protein ACD_12C00789G0001 [uncultured bacterium]|nr:MAG: hypothetical protein ACD_12C00789G0001 [uncultured bacterium]